MNVFNVGKKSRTYTSEEQCHQHLLAQLWRPRKPPPQDRRRSKSTQQWGRILRNFAPVSRKLNGMGFLTSLMLLYLVSWSSGSIRIFLMAQFLWISWVSLTLKFTSSMNHETNRNSFMIHVQINPQNYVPKSLYETDNWQKLALSKNNDSTYFIECSIWHVCWTLFLCLTGFHLSRGKQQNKCLTPDQK